MKITIERGMEVTFPPLTLVRVFQDMEMEERSLRERFRKGGFCEVFPRNPVPDKKYAVFQSSNGRMFLFRLRCEDKNTWNVFSVQEIYGSTKYPDITILEGHIESARKTRRIYEQVLPGNNTSPTRCKVKVVTTFVRNGKTTLSAACLGSVSIEEGSSFMGSGVDFLKRFVVRNRLDRLDKVECHAGVQASIELHIRGKSTPLRVIPLAM